MRKKFLLTMLTLLFVAMGSSGKLFAADGNVAKVGNTEYATIDEAIANWTNGTTLTLLADVTLSKTIELSSIEHHILDLGTYTMTAFSEEKKFLWTTYTEYYDAIQIVNNGRTSASYALDIIADANNPGGITATDKAVVKTTGKDGVQDRPIIRFYGGVFTASNVISHSGSNGTNCPQFQFHGGVFNGTVNANRALIQFYGGTFNGNINISVDSSAYALVAGGRFKKLSNQYGSALNSSKFTIGSAKGVYDRGIYVDKDGYYVVTSVITEVSAKYPAVMKETYNSNNYFYYSAANTYGMFYEVASMAGTGSNVTVWEKPAVTIPETLTGDLVEEIKNNTALKDYTPENLPAGAELEIELVSVGETFVYNVTPMEDGTEVEPTEAITFRLPVPASVTKAYAKVYHEEDLMGIYEINGEGNAKYVEVSSKDFSEFAVEPINVVAKIGDVLYTSLEEAFTAATEDQTITLLADATPALTSQKAITKAPVIELNGKTLTLTEDDLYFGTTTFQNGTIVVDPSVKASTAVFWMFENQTLTFNKVAITATGVTGTYLIGINGGTGTAVILNESSITIDNETKAGLTAVICDNGTGNNVTIENSAINVKNIEGRFYLGGKNGSVVVENTTANLNGVKEGFYLRAGQSLDINGTSVVNITLNSTDGRYGINLTDVTARYTKAETAKVNASVHEIPTVAKIGETPYASLQAAINAAVLMTGDVTIEIMGGTYADDINLTNTAITTGDVNSRPNITFVPVAGAEVILAGTTTLGYRQQNVGASMWNGKVTFNGITFNHAENGKHSIDIQDVKGVALNNCEVIGDGEYGIGSNSGNATTDATFTSCTFKNGAMQVLGQLGAHLVVKNSIFNDFSFNVQGGANPGMTIQNSTFNMTLIDAHVDESFYAVRTNACPVNIEGTKFNIDSEVSSVAADQAKWGIFWARKDSNVQWKIAGCEVNLTDAAMAQTELLLTKNDTTTYDNAKNRILITELTSTRNNVADLVKRTEGCATINGVKYLNGELDLTGLVAKVGDEYYATLAEAFAAAQNDDEVVVLQSGTYALSTSGKNITITGNVSGVVFENIGAKNMGGANVTFNNVTFDYYPNVNYTGLQHSGNLVYNNCTFNGQVFLYGNKETFNNCTFNQNSSDAYNVWTYGAKKVAFNECTFECAGKSVLIYHESASVINNVAVDKCTFIASTAVEGKAAIEMDSSLTAGINLTIDSETTATGFGTGNVSGNSLWNNKKGNADAANNDITVVFGDVVVLAPIYEAQIDEVKYRTLQAAVNAVQERETITILAGTISEGTIKLPATLNNVIFKGVEGAILKDMTISAADGNSYNYVGLTFDGITFDNSRILLTGWRNGEETIENLTVTNCTFKNLNDNTNTAPVHINKDAAEAVNGFTFTNNVIDGAIGGSKSGVYAQLTGNVTFTGNVINNVSFRPYVIQITTDDGIADNFVVEGNTFSGSAIGRAQGLGNNVAGTDVVNLVVSNNIFKDITDAQQICYWNFNAAKTTAVLSKNYYDIDIEANPGKIYFNTSAQGVGDLVEMGIFPYYTELNADGTINTESAVQAPAAIAKIGEKNYYSLQAAVNAVVGDTPIDIIKDIELTAQNAQEYFKPAYNRESYCGIVIPDDKAIVLNLNGHTVSYVDTYGDVDNVMIMNLGNLTINDTEGGKLTYKPVASTSSYSKFYSTIFNCGTLTVNGGTIENTCETATDVTNAVDNHSRLSHEYGNNCILTVNGGTLTGSAYYSVRQYTHYLEGVENRVIINDGIFNNGIYMQHGDSWYYADPAKNRLHVDCKLTINGGTFNTHYEGASCVVSRLSNPDNNAWGLEINGGTFEAPIKLRVQRGTYYENGVSGTTVPAEDTGARNEEWLEKNGGFIKGGTFADLGSADDVTSNLYSFLAEGCQLKENGDGTYGIVKGSVTPAYTSATTIWGEGGGNATESLVVKLYSEETLLATASLNNINGILNGNVYVTWNIPVNATGNDEYWTVVWENNIKVDRQPTKVVMCIDGTDVAENNYQLNTSDDLNKIYAATADADGNILAYYETFEAAVAAGNNVAILRAGTYSVPTGKDLTITGTVEGVQFGSTATPIITPNMGGANVTFNNVTFNYANVNYRGLQHAGDLAYNNCTFNGQVFLYGNKETFNKCTFNQNSSDAYNVWTYGAKEVAFNECTFNSAGKSVLIYSESATVFNDVTVTKCTFNASTAVDGKAAIEMDSSLTSGINLTISNTTATGFGSGNVSGNSLWNNKKGVTSEANNDITVIIDGDTVLSPAPIMVTYPEGKVEFYHNMLDAVPYTTNCPRLEGATIKLLDDVAAPGLRFMENGMVFDLNGKIYTITAGTGSQGTNTSGFQIRPEVTTNVVFKNGTINVAEGAPVVYMFNNYATNFIVENVTVDCSNMAWSYGNSCYVVVSRGNQSTTGPRNVEFKGLTKIENFNSEVAGTAYSIDGNMTVGENVDCGGSFKLVAGATLKAKEGLDVVTSDGNIIVYKNGEYKSVAIVAKSYNTNGELVANYGDFESAIADAANVNITRIEVLGDYTQESVANTSDYYDVKQNLTIAASTGKNYTVKGCGFAVRVQNAATLTIANNLTIEGLDVVANGFGTSGEKMVIDGTIKALSLKQWTSNDTITVNGKVELGYGDGQFDMAYGNGNVVVNGNCNGEYNTPQFKAGYSGTRGNGGVLTLNDTYFEAGAWFTVSGSNTTINVNKSLLKVSGGDHSGALTLDASNTINLDINSQVVAGSISGAGTITIDADDFVFGKGDVQVVTANMNGFTGTINVVNNNYVTAVKTDNGIVIKENELEGEGTVDNPYVLETLTELELFRNKVNAGDNYANKYVKLTADVDLSATRSANNWEPIGTTSNPFKGTFDGADYIISNLVVEGENYVGLFGKTVGATINNVTINNANVSGRSYVGAIVGMGYTGTINNCHVTGTIQIEGKYMVGGISGQGYAKIYNSSVIATANSNSYVKGVYSAADIEGDNVGGIVGHCGETNNLEGNTVKNITISGTRKVGGIVGIADMSTDIDACVVENVTIETSASTDYANANIKTMSIGALIGQYQDKNAGGTVTNSTVKNVTFNNVNNVTVSAGPITGGKRGGSDGMLAPTGVTSSNNDIYMSTITGSNNLFLMNAVAEIDGVDYYTLQDAFNAGGEVVVLRDITLTETATIPAGKVVTLDLAGYTISQEKACTGNYNMIYNKGTLTIKGNGRLSFKDTGADDPSFGWGSYTLRNEGTLVVENGTIEHLGEQNPGNGQQNVHMYCAIFQYSGSTTINGGTISTPTYRSARLWNGNMTINGGNFVGQLWLQAVSNSANLAINGGTFAPRGNDGSSVFVSNSSYDVAFAVTGGTFATKIGANDVEKAGVKGAITGGTFDDNTTNAKLLAEGFEFVFNGVNYTVKQTSGTQTREFASAGWYWFSTYINLEGTEGLETLQDSLGGNAKQIKGQEGFTQYYSAYQAWSPGGLTAISTAKMYMINTTAPVTVELSGDFVDYEERDITLNPGWNWIGYPVRDNVNVKDALTKLTPSNGDVIKSKDWSMTYIMGQWLGNKEMTPGMGYMYKSNANNVKTFKYSTNVTNNSRSENTVEEYHWIADASKYPSNMTVIAMLNIDGETAADNYEVAAFANGECRGSARPIYVEAIDSYVLVMTIQGEEVEELTFKCYDVNYGTEYELSNRVNYSNDAVLGSIDEPYMFNMNFLNIEESTLDMINIYPNPTTRDRAISLQATCDNVEVFNALGVKVAEYQNVDSIDALETAGVYVIRVTINGETRNCRLVVK